MHLTTSRIGAIFLLLVGAVSCHKSPNNPPEHKFTASDSPVKVRGGSLFGEGAGGWSTCDAYAQESCAQIPKGDSYNLSSEDFDANIPAQIQSPTAGQSWRITFTNPDKDDNDKDAVYFCNYPNCSKATGNVDNGHVFVKLVNSATSRWEPVPPRLYFHYKADGCDTGNPHETDGPCDKLRSAKLEVDGALRAELKCSVANAKNCVIGVSSP